MIRRPINIFGQDAFFVRGVHSIINKLIRSVAVNVSGSIYIPDIWVFSDSTMADVLPFVRQLRSDASYIIFGNERCCRLFDNVPNVNVLCFIEVDASVIETEKVLREHLEPLLVSRGKKNVPAISIENPVLSASEIKVIRLFSLGLSLGRIAELYDLSIKTISAHKRMAMRRLDVKSDQELILKSLLLGVTKAPSMLH